jgi:hypothetical protein
MHASRTPNLDNINKILRYLKNTLEKEIGLKNNYSNEICDFSYADWAGIIYRKLTISFYIFIGRNIIT